MGPLAKALRRDFTPSLPVPVGESPTGTGPDGIGMLPTNSAHGYEMCGLEMAAAVHWKWRGDAFLLVSSV